jgi:hypothetical protein
MFRPNKAIVRYLYVKHTGKIMHNTINSMCKIDISFVYKAVSTFPLAMLNNVFAFFSRREMFCPEDCFSFAYV